MKVVHLNTTGKPIKPIKKSVDKYDSARRWMIKAKIKDLKDACKKYGVDYEEIKKLTVGAVSYGKN